MLLWATNDQTQVKILRSLQYGSKLKLCKRSMRRGLLETDEVTELNRNKGMKIEITAELKTEEI